MLTIRRKRRAFQDLDMTPLMDVVFLLLLFFMLTSSIIIPHVIELKLPDSETASGKINDALPRVQLLADGSLAMDERPVTAEELARRIGQALSGMQSKELVLEADMRCSIQQMVDAMDQLKKAGGDQVHLVTERRL